MMSRPLLVALLLCCAAAGARASDATPNLPTLALDPQPPTSLWHGLYVGTEVMAVSHGGRKGGGFGGAVYAGYDREFANNIVLGVVGSTGYTPALFGHGRVHGFDFAEADMKVGYDMGRVMPWMTAGVVLAKPSFGSGPGMGHLADDSLNNLFNNSSNLQAAGRVGAGVDYALTNNLTVGVGVSVGSARGGFVGP